MEKIVIPKAIYRPDKKKWIINVPVKYSPTGKRTQILGNTEEEVITGFKKLVVVPEEGITVQSYMLYVLLTYFYKNVDNTTYDRYEGTYQKHILNSEFGKMQICNVTGNYLTEWMKQFTNGKYQKQTPAHLKVIIDETFLRAKQNKIITDNIAEYMSMSYKYCKKPSRYADTIFTLEELVKIEELIKDSWDGKVKGHNTHGKRLYHYSPIFMIMAYTGLRIGEMLGLKKEDIDRVDRCVLVKRQCVEEYERDEKGNRLRKVRKITSPKTDSGNRTVPLSNIALSWFDELERRQMELGINSEFIIVNKSGNHPTKSNVYDMWKRMLDDAGLTYRSPHKLRKTFITFAIDGGSLSIKEVSEMVGHKQFTTTLNTYYKPVIDQERHMKEAKIIDDIFSGKESATKKKSNAKRPGITFGITGITFGQNPGSKKVREAL